MATAKQKQRYAQRLKRIFAQQDRLENDAVFRIVSMLDDLRKEIGLIVLDADDFQTANLQAIIGQVATAVNAFASSLNEEALIAIGDIYTLGGDSITEPALTAGVSLPSVTLNSQRLSILEAFGLDLVRDVADEAKRRISAQIRLAAVGGISPRDVMRTITDILGIVDKRRMVTKGISYRAERIFRTELNRVFSVGAYDKLTAVSAIIPDVQKQWLSTGDNRTRDSHLAAHGQVQDYDKPFNVGGEDLDYPLDPSGSAKNVINCRCRIVTVYPDIGALLAPEDVRIEKERARRG